MNDLLIIGSGAQGRLITEIVNYAYKHYVANVADSHTDISDEIKQGIIAIGDNKIRLQVFNYVLDLIPDFRFKYIVHPTAVIGENVTIGRGAMIMANTVLNNNCHIGEFSLVNTGTIVEHDCKIGNFVNLQPRVVMGGYTEIGDMSYVGLGAMIRDRVKIGSGATIGMGAVVLTDVNDNLTAWGNPAKTINK